MKKKTTTEFINDAISVHGDKYDYSLVEYLGSRNKVNIVCRIHGSWYQEAASHLMGYGCRRCRDDKRSLSTKEFIKRSVDIHGDTYSYELTKYVSYFKPVIIICKEHGQFRQRPHGHLAGKGCSMCQRYDTVSFIRSATVVHDNKYDYSLVDYQGYDSLISVICPIHGIFTQRANSHLSATGCPTCSSSRGEILVRKLLSNLEIEFIQQHKFDDCKNKNPLPFDFYLPKLNTCIEYQGRHHYYSTKWNSKMSDIEADQLLEYVRVNDNIKRNYCQSKQITLIEIPYSMNNSQIEDLIITIGEIKS
jgi:hypothetical protein